jgi:hypothetical protein
LAPWPVQKRGLPYGAGGEPDRESAKAAPAAPPVNPRPTDTGRALTLVRVEGSCRAGIYPAQPRSAMGPAASGSSEHGRVVEGPRITCGTAT